MEDNLKTPIYKRWWVILIAVYFGIGVIGTVLTNGSEAAELNTTASVVKQVTKEHINEHYKTPPDVVAAELIEKKFGSNNNENAVISAKFESGVIEVIALEENFLSAETAKRTFLENTVAFMEAMKAQTDVTQATLIVQAPLSDRYGNVENGDVMIVIMSRETLEKIHFENFQVNNLSSVADSYWEHPALSAK